MVGTKSGCSNYYIRRDFPRSPKAKTLKDYNNNIALVGSAKKKKNLKNNSSKICPNSYLKTTKLHKIKFTALGDQFPTLPLLSV